MQSLHHSILKSWPSFEPSEKKAVNTILSSNKVNYWTSNVVQSFEKDFAEYLNVKHAIGVFNGTVALELGLHALGIKENDEVIVPCRTFIASASAIVARGAKPVLADIELPHQNITVQTIQKQLTHKTKAIIVVHLAGWPANMPEIMAFANQHNLYVIEDCAQAHGAEINGQKVGSFGHINTFSFCQDKIMTTGGEGGMLVTNDTKLWKTAWAYKDHGKSLDLTQEKNSSLAFKWVHTTFGTNFRMLPIQAAIGIHQLKKLDTWVEKRTKNANILFETLSKFSFIKTFKPDPSIKHAYYKYYAFIDSKLNISQQQLLEKINAAGIPCFNGSCHNIGFEEAFQTFPSEYKKALPNAEQIRDKSLMFLIHPTITNKEMQTVKKQLLSCLSALTVN